MKYINGSDLREGDVFVTGSGSVATVVSLDPFTVATGAGTNLGNPLAGSRAGLSGETLLLLSAGAAS